MISILRSCTSILLSADQKCFPFGLQLSIQCPVSCDKSTKRLLKAATENHRRRVRLVAAKEISVDAAVAVVSTKFDGLFTLKEALMNEEWH